MIDIETADRTQITPDNGAEFLAAWTKYLNEVTPGEHDLILDDGPNSDGIEEWPQWMVADMNSGEIMAYWDERCPKSPYLAPQ